MTFESGNYDQQGSLSGGFLGEKVVRAGLEPATPAFSVQGHPDEIAVICGDSGAVAESLHQRLHLAADLLHFAGLLRDALDTDQRRRLAVELLRE